MTHPRFKISKAAGGQFTFNLTSSNGEIILASESYKSRDGAEDGIAAVKANASTEERYVRKTASDRQFFFVLRAGNNETIGRSEMYETAQGRDAGIESVKVNARAARVET